MSRPRGFLLNPDALDDWLVARKTTRSELADAAGIGPSTLSGLARQGEKQKGASLPVALRLAESLRVRPGSIFPELVGRVADEVAA